MEVLGRTLMKFCCQIKVLSKNENAGMTLLESLLAISMLVVFTGVVAMVMQFTLNFFREVEAGQPNSSGVSNGVLIDHQQLHMAMDDLIEVLAQPGISLAGIAEPVSVNPAVACTGDPVNAWGLHQRIDAVKIKSLIPSGYRLCLWTTVMPQGTSASGPAEIYLLQALPKNLSSSSLPTRRFFCHPRPYC